MRVCVDLSTGIIMSKASLQRETRTRREAVGFERTVAKFGDGSEEGAGGKIFSGRCSRKRETEPGAAASERERGAESSR